MLPVPLMFNMGGDTDWFWQCKFAIVSSLNSAGGCIRAGKVIDFLVVAVEIG